MGSTTDILRRVVNKKDDEDERDKLNVPESTSNKKDEDRSGKSESGKVSTSDILRRASGNQTGSTRSPSVGSGAARPSAQPTPTASRNNEPSKTDVKPGHKTLKENEDGARAQIAQYAEKRKADGQGDLFAQVGGTVDYHLGNIKDFLFGNEYAKETEQINDEAKRLYGALTSADAPLSLKGESGKSVIDSLSDSKKALDGMEQRLGQMMEEYKRNPSDALAAQYDQLATQYNQAVAEHNKAYAQYEPQLKAYNDALNAYNAYVTEHGDRISVPMEDEYSPYRKQLDALESEITRLGNRKAEINSALGGLSRAGQYGGAGYMESKRKELADELADINVQTAALEAKRNELVKAGGYLSDDDILGGLAYGGERFLAGALGMGENITDFIGTNLYGALEGVTSLGGYAPNPVSKWAGDAYDSFAGNSITADYEESIRKRYKPTPKDEELTGFMQTVEQVALPIAAGYGISKLAGMGSGATTGSLAAPNTATIAANATKGVFGASAAGGATREAHAAGASHAESLTYGWLVGAMEMSVEELSGAIPGLPDGSKMANVVKKVFSDPRVHAVVSHPAVQRLLGGVGEGAEEALSAIFTPYIQRATYDPNASLATAEDIGEQALLGGLASLCIGAGIDIPSYVAESIYARNRLAVDEFDAETIQGILDTGLESPTDTNSYKIAAELKRKLDAGNDLTASEVMDLYRENVKQVNSENAEQGADEAIMDAAREAVGAVTEAYDNYQPAQEENAAEAPQNEAQAIPYNLMPIGSEQREQAVKQELQRRTAESKRSAVEAWTGYGEHGTEAFTDIAEKSGQDLDLVRLAFQSAYEMGTTDTAVDESRMNSVQLAAYKAGQLDRLKNIQRANLKARETYIWDDGLDTNSIPAEVGLSQREIDDARYLFRALGVKGGFGKTGGNASITDKGVVTIAADFGISDEKLKALGNMSHLAKVKKLAKERGRSFISVLAHELTVHRVMQLAPTEFRSFMDAMYRNAGKDLPAAFGTLAQQKQEKYGEQGVSLTTDKAIEEIVADLIVGKNGLYKTDAEFMAAVRKAIEGAKTAEEAAKVEKGARTWLDSIKAFLRKLGERIKVLKGAQKEQAQQVYNEVSELKNLFETALKAATDRVTAEREAGTSKKSANETGRTADGRGTMDYSMKEAAENDGAERLSHQDGASTAAVRNVSVDSLDRKSDRGGEEGTSRKGQSSDRAALQDLIRDVPDLAAMLGVEMDRPVVTRNDAQLAIKGLPAEDAKIANNARMGAAYSRSLSTMSEARLDDVYGDYSYPYTIDKTKAYLTYIDPWDFLSLTNTSVQDFLDENPERLNEGENRQWGGQNNIYNTDKMFLRIDDAGNVTNHEGRHRMAALYREGVNKVAIVVNFEGDAVVENARPIGIKKLLGQKNNGIMSYSSVYIHDALPVSKEYEAINRYVFGSVSKDNSYAKPNIQFSLKDGGITMTEEEYLDLHDVQYNLKAEESHKVALKKNYSAAESVVSRDALMARYEKVLEIWKRIGGELNSKFLEDWNNKTDRVFTIFKAQQGYKYNVELSAMCKKGVPLFEAIDTIVKKEVMRELRLDVLGKAEKEILYDILKQHNFEIPCAICYVEQARQREGVIIDAFLNGSTEDGKSKLGWNTVLDDIEAEMKANGVEYKFQNVSRSIATEKYTPADIAMDENTLAAFHAAVQKLANKEIRRYNKEEGKSRKLLKEVTPEGVKACFGGTLPSNLKIFKTLLTEPSSRFRIGKDLLYSSMTTTNLASLHNGLYGLFNAQGGVSGYKTKQSTTVYWGELLSKRWRPDIVRREGGIRQQSNSDFQMYTFLDKAQMYIDHTAKGYYVQEYTKVLAELKLFGLSRAKMNASLIPKVVEYKNADGSVDVERTMLTAGLDEYGNPIYDDIEGINHAEAFMLLEDPNYSRSLCGICIGYSDKHIEKLLDEPRVQMIIGFHDKTNDPDKRYRGARYAKNYNGLNEAVADNGAGKTVHIGFNPYLQKAEKRFTRNESTKRFEGTTTFGGKQYVANDIPRLAADMYLADCAKKGYRPAYNDFTGHPNYYKLLSDIGLYDSLGQYAPHEKVAFKMPDRVPYLDKSGNKRTMSTEEYIKTELQKEMAVRDSIAEALADTSENGIIPQFKAAVEAMRGEETQHSLKDYTVSAEDDAAYMDAYFDGDDDLMQEMVDKAAKKAGYTYKAYHHTENAFTVFDRSKARSSMDIQGFFFSADPDAEREYGSARYDTYLKMTNPYIVDSREAQQAIPFDMSRNNAGVIAREWLQEHGYDGVIRKAEYFGAEADEYVVFDPSQIKSAEPMTFADDEYGEGDVIPLSERFDSSNDDIRYSLKDDGDLIAENAKLKEVNRALREQFKVTKLAKVDKKSLEKFSKQLLKDWQSRADIDETRDALEELYTFIRTEMEKDEPDMAAMEQKAYEVAEGILTQSVEVDDQMYQDYKELRSRLRTTGVSIDPSYGNSLMGYEDLQDFRKRNMGRIKLRKDGLPVDVLYQELASTYPDLFNEAEHSNPADQLVHIAEVLEEMRPIEVNPYKHEMREAATWLATDIMHRIYELPQAKPTFADKAAAKLAEQKEKGKQKLYDAVTAERMAAGRELAEQKRMGRQKLAEQREKMNERISKLIADSRDKLRLVQTEERVKRETAVKTIKDRYKAKEAKASESRQATILRAKIIRHVGPMLEKVSRPSNKKHIPDELTGTVIELLKSINLESGFEYVFGEDGKYHRVARGTELGAEPSKRTEHFKVISKMLSDIRARGLGNMSIDPSLIGSTADGIPSKFEEVIEMGDKPLSEMNLKELTTVWEVLRATEHAISTANKVFASEKRAEIEAWANDFENDTDTRRQKRALTNHWTLDIETPYTFFSHFGEAGNDLWRMLRAAQDDQYLKKRNLDERMSEIASKEARKKLTSEKDAVTFDTARGEKLTLTRAQIMEVYLLSRRKAALNHLVGNGIRQPKIGKIDEGTTAIRLTEMDVAKIASSLSEDEMAMADKFQALTKVLADWANEAHLKVFGYQKFGDPNYWPIKSTSLQTKKDVGQKAENRSREIANIGAAKELIPHANNAVDLPGIFDTFDQHASEMLTYAAWLAPMEDAKRLLNYRYMDEDGTTRNTMTGLLDRVAGKGGAAYWQDLMVDIQNGLSMKPETAADAVIGRMMSTVKRSSVAANARVVIQQPTAYARAALVLDPDIMLLAAGKAATVKSAIAGWKKAVKLSPIAMMKQEGGYEIAANPKQLGDSLYQSETKWGRIKDFAKEAGMALPGAADAFTWGIIWNACEMQVKRNSKNIAPGTSFFDSAVKTLFENVIEQTQVVDGVLQRSAMMRAGSVTAKSLAAFTGEPTQGANMVIRAYDKLRYETDPKKRGKAIKGLSRAATVYVVNAVLNAFMQSLVDGFRDDDDDKDYWERVWAAFHGINGDEETWRDFARAILMEGNVVNGLNPLSWLPLTREVMSLIQGYSVERLDTSAIADVITSAQNLDKAISGDGKQTVGYALLKTGLTGLRLFGSGASNLVRDIEGAVRSIQGATKDYKARYNTMKLMYQPENNKSQFMDVLYNAYQDGGDDYEQILDDMLKGDYFKGEKTTTQEYIMSAMDDRLMEEQGVKKVSELDQRFLFPDQQKDYDSRMSALTKSGLWDDANKKQRNGVKADLYGIVTESKGSEDMRERIAKGKPYDLDETEYLLYQLALEMHDKPNDKGKLGTYTSAERADALLAADLGDDEMAYLWDSKKGYEALDDGISMEHYIRFAAGVASLVPGVDYKKGNSASRKAAVKAVLRDMGLTSGSREYRWLLGTEF